MKNFLLKSSLLLVCLSQPLLASGLWGQLETTLQADNQYSEDEAFIEQWGDVKYTSDDIETALAFGLRTGIKGMEAQLHQAYIRKNWQPYTITAGRFERADLTGFYYLDGVVLQRKINKFNVTMYAGNNRRIEYFDSKSNNSLIGLDTQLLLPASLSLLKKTSLKLGFQHLDKSVNRLNFGLTDMGNIAMLKNIKLASEGSLYLEQHKIDHFLFHASSKMTWREHAGRIGTSYETYNPLKPLLTFRERFYCLYARGRQSGFGGYVFYNQWKFEGRKLWRDFGDSGYAGAISLINKSWESRLDWINVGNERAINWFISSEKPLTSRWLGIFSGVLQCKSTELIEKNLATGLAVQLKHKFKRNIFVNFFAEYIWHTQMDNEYQIGVRLQKSFYGK